ncbi:hypothetical protein [Halalkalibacter lacteus]|uniref:hypothetical protein n=1 Tax=Halalkalibacter lacteus TaxID=3090663 RepID=UPI002FCB53C9
MKYVLKFCAWFLFLFISGWLLGLSMAWKSTVFFPTSPLHILSLVTPAFIQIIFGVLLASKHLITEFRTEGSWRINLEKFNILALLPLVIVMVIVIFYDQMSTIVNLTNFQIYMISSFVLILFGYYSSHSLYKVKN